MALLELFLSVALAQNSCRQHNPAKAGVPLCPTTGSRLLSENYPVMAATVSDEAGGSRYVQSYVVKTLQAQGDNPPQFFLHVTPSTYDDVVAAIRKNAPSPQVAQKWIQSLTRVEGSRRWNWQQDYFESFFDPNTGRPVLREVQGYERHGDSFSAMLDKTQKECGIGAGPVLETNLYQDGHSGGNIEAVNGLCLLGSDHFTDATWDRYAKSTCSDMNTAVKTPSDFLRVGHTDEFFKTLKDPRKSPPCDFSLAFASPKRGLDLLKAHPNDRAFDFSHVSPEEALVRMTKGNYRLLCHKYLQKKQNNSPTQPGSAAPKGGVTQLLLEWTLHRAFAGAASLDSNPVDKLLEELQDLEDTQPRSQEERQRLRERKTQLRNRIREFKAQAGYKKNQETLERARECYNMTNRELAELIESDPEIKAFNESVEKAIQDFKTDLLAKLKTKYPQCSPQTLDIPDLFIGMMDEDGGKPTYAKGTGESIFPNPTNGEIIGNTFILPEPVNPAFKKDIDAQVRATGLKTDYIDTNFAHMLQGNLHCSSHTMRYCRPAGGTR